MRNIPEYTITVKERKENERNDFKRINREKKEDEENNALI